MIAFERVTITYSRAMRPAVDDVSLAVGRGRFTAIVGPNGSGKSTLVRALVGRVPLAAGRIVVDGSDVSQMARGRLAKRVAVVAQREEPVLALGLESYVALGRYPHLGDRGSLAPVDRDAVTGAIERTGIAALRDRPMDTLSGGEWQRARLARALAQGTETLVLDEPTTFLDIAHEMAVFELLHGIASEGKAVLLVSHQLNLVARFAQHIVLLHDGRVAAAGGPDDVMQASVLERVYEWPLVVTRDPAIGTPTLLPLRQGTRH
jgi:ABC-type cobalamin/Fe3+-siderophores transport system ATPase subunit